MPIRAAYDKHTRELYVTYANGPGPNGQSDGSVHKLRTANGKWTEVTPVKPGGTTTGGTAHALGSGGGSADTFGYGGVAVDARRPGTLVVSTNNRGSDIDTVFRSTNGGRTWTSLKDSAVLDVSETPYLKWGADKPKFGWWIQALALDPYDSKRIVHGTGATLYGTRDLTHWAPQIRGPEEASIHQSVSSPTGEAHQLSGSGDIGVLYHERLTASPSRGLASNPVFGTSTGLSPAAAKPSYVVRAGWSADANGAYSNDGGRTWAPFGAQPAVAKEAPGPIAPNADGSVLLWSFGPANPGYRSVDNGGTWSEVASFPKGAAPIADPLDPTRFYAVDTTTGTVFASTDSGRTFTARATGLITGDSEFQLTAVPGRIGDLWLSLKGNVLHRSTDAGATFAKVSGCHAAHTLGFGKAAKGALPTRRSTWSAPSEDPRGYGRVYVSTDGRGVQYGEPA